MVWIWKPACLRGKCLKIEWVIGYVWIELILLKLKTKNWKLKTENWKHYSKIIFKCVNSTVRSILMKKLIKNEICGSVNSAWMHSSRKTSQKLRLLFIYRTWTVTSVGEKAWKKKKKKRENAANMDPNCAIVTIGLKWALDMRINHDHDN